MPNSPFQQYAQDYQNWQWANQGYAKSGTPKPSYNINYGGPNAINPRDQALFDYYQKAADPRAINQSPAMARLMQIANGGGGAMKAGDEAMAPALAQFQKYLSAADPLGTAMLPDLVRQRGLGEVRGNQVAANRRIQDSFGGMHGSADPSALAFMKSIAGNSIAGGMGDVERNAAEARISERTAAAQFRTGILDSMMAWAGTRGGLAAQDQSTQAGAAGSALTAESFGRNTWAQTFADLLGRTQRPMLFSRIQGLGAFT